MSQGKACQISHLHCTDWPSHHKLVSGANTHPTPAASVTPPLSLAMCASLMEEATREGSGLNQPMDELSLSTTGALGDRQTDRLTDWLTTCLVQALYSAMKGSLLSGEHTPSFQTGHLSKLLVHTHFDINKSLQLTLRLCRNYCAHIKYACFIAQRTICFTIQENRRLLFMGTIEPLSKWQKKEKKT